MKLLPRDRYQGALFLAFLIFFAGSCVAPPYLQFLLMQHVPTVLAAFLLAYLSNRFSISRLSFFAIILFLSLHTLCILATSAAYELIEWLVAVVFTPEWADNFLGHQGDNFDAQKDMALAIRGLTPPARRGS